MTPTQNGTEPYIAVPARARTEVVRLTEYLDLAVKNLLEANVHVRDTSSTVPGVLNDLRDVVRMTESATVKVLEETEALMDERRAAAELVAGALREAESGGAPAVAAPLRELDAMLQRLNDRLLAIFSALEFQDLTAQRVQRAFKVLEEVAERMVTIQTLIDVGQEVAPPARLEEPLPTEGKSGQDLVDELLAGFRPADSGQ